MAPGEEGARTFRRLQTIALDPQSGERLNFLSQLPDAGRANGDALAIHVERVPINVAHGLAHSCPCSTLLSFTEGRGSLARRLCSMHEKSPQLQAVEGRELRNAGKRVCASVRGLRGRVRRFLCALA